MKYISLLIISLLIFSCGKKTDPIPKDSIENVQAPKKFIVKNQDEGVFIANNEDAFLIVEKAVHNGAECSEYSMLTILDPRTDFIDEDVEREQPYLYRFTKRTVKYKLLSDPVVKPVVFNKPVNIAEALYTIAGETIELHINPTDQFMRMDIISGNKSIIQTGYQKVEIPLSEIINDTLSIRLTDYYGNTGEIYTLRLKEEPAPERPAKPENLSAVLLGGTLRIVWDSRDSDYTYDVDICENVSCETINTLLPFAVYRNEFGKCLDITVYSVKNELKSDGESIRFCR